MILCQSTWWLIHNTLMSLYTNLMESIFVKTKYLFRNIIFYTKSAISTEAWEGHRKEKILPRGIFSRPRGIFFRPRGIYFAAGNIFSAAGNIFCRGEYFLGRGEYILPRGIFSRPRGILLHSFPRGIFFGRGEYFCRGEYFLGRGEYCYISFPRRIFNSAGNIWFRG